jgi:hypothetical protein
MKESRFSWSKIIPTLLPATPNMVLLNAAGMRAKGRGKGRTLFWSVSSLSRNWSVDSTSEVSNIK